MSHHLDPKLARYLRVDTHGDDRASEDVQTHAAPLELYCLVATPGVPNLQVQRSQPSKNMPGTSRVWWTVWAEEFGKVTPSPHLLVVGFPLQPLSLEPPHLEKRAPSKAGFARLGICLGHEWEGGEGMRHKPKGVWIGTCHSYFQSGRGISRRLRLPQ